MIVNVRGSVISNSYNYEINLTAQDKGVQLIAKATSAMGNVTAISKSTKPKKSKR
jgi:hypothetical protein